MSRIMLVPVCLAFIVSSDAAMWASAATKSCLQR